MSLHDFTWPDPTWPNLTYLWTWPSSEPDQPRTLTGQCHEIFCFWFFYESISSQPQSIPLGPFPIFFQKSRRYSQLKVDHRCRWHRWQMKKIFNQKNFNNFVGTPVRYPEPPVCRRCRWYTKGILKGLGETDSWKKPEAKNLLTLSLKYTWHDLTSPGQAWASLILPVLNLTLLPCNHYYLTLPYSAPAFLGRFDWLTWVGWRSSLRHSDWLDPSP